MSFDLDKFEYDMSVLFQTDIILEFIREVITKLKNPPKIDISIINDGQVSIKHNTYEITVTLYKFHLMFQPDKIEEVLTLLFSNYETFPSFKILNYKPVQYEVFPDFKEEYRPILHEKMPVGFITNTGINYYTYNGKDYLYEPLFPPMIAIYASNDTVARNIASKLLELFNDRVTADMVIPLIPRLNFKLNNMVYFSLGHSVTKFMSIEKNCIRMQDKYNCTNKDDLQLPDEYKEIMSLCSTKDSKDTCQKLNSLPKNLSNHSLCQWTKDKCDSVSKLSPFLLIDKKETIQSIYEKIGQKARYDELVKKDTFFNVKKRLSGGKKTQRLQKKVSTKKKSSSVSRKKSKKIKANLARFLKH